MQIKPRLRYYARFNDSFGYLRAVVCYGKVRKYITTRLVITKEQLPRLDSAGRLIVVNSTSDELLNGRLYHCTRAIWSVVMPLIDDGTFEATDSADINRALFDFQDKELKEQRARLAERVPKSAVKVSPKELVQMIRELQAAMPPEDFKALWEKGNEP